MEIVIFLMLYWKDFKFKWLKKKTNIFEDNLSQIENDKHLINRKSLNNINPLSCKIIN